MDKTRPRWWGRDIFVSIPEQYRVEFRQETSLINLHRWKVSNFIIIFIILIQTAVLALQFDHPGELFFVPPGVYYIYLFVPVFAAMCISFFFFIRIEKRGYHLKVVSNIELGLSLLLLLWAAGVTLVDQEVQGHIITYMIAVLAVGVVPLLGPSRLLAVYTAAHLFFVFSLPFFQSSPEILTSHYLNSTAIVILGWVISRVLFLYWRNDFVNRKIIAETNVRLIELNKKLEQLSSVDELTGVSNRRTFNRTLDLEWERVRREEKLISLMIIDIDNLKTYNDNYGHLAGDACIKAIAMALQKSLKRSTDLVARIGGDEFAALLPNTGEKGAAVVALRMREKVAALSIPHAFSDVAPYVTVSIGTFTVSPTEGSSPDDSLERADQALIQIKHQRQQGVDRVGGRSQFFHDPYE